ncbi:ACT domain-containing protein [Chachezhania sediminis]|uniref:ACT domain-containing protein n=1 Tax=Chachezhania sediminis TaxID=2599291 RepID=UPI00131B34C5|nr:ACT domain-containing protein [Chachezhania sediminis]
MIVKDTAQMISGMQPELDPETWHFCSLIEAEAPELAQQVRAAALGIFVEDEGLTGVLSQADAERLDLVGPLPLRRITLRVFSALDGVGLTAAVAETLADAGIPCNVVAAYHHDHVFVPEALAEEALLLLMARAEIGA